MCVRVCVWNLKDREKKKIDVTALHLLQNMPDSLWWDRLTPNASPPHPPPIPPHAPRPHHIHLGSCDICSGHCGASLLVAMAASGESPPIGCSRRGGKKAHSVRGRVPSALCRCFQSAAGGAPSAERAAAGRGPQGPPAAAVDTAGRSGGPRGQCH